MTDVELVTLLLLAVGALSALAASLPVAHPVVLVLGGLALGFLPGTPDVQLEPDVVFLLFLPPLLYAAAFQITSEDVRENLRPIGFLAVGLVLATVGAVAVAAHEVAGLGWGPAFVLGAVLGPTDPVAATSTIRRLGAPTRIATILEGESLVNDGTALVALRIAIGAVGASFSLTGALVEFGWNVAAGVAIGLLAGWASGLVRQRAEQPAIVVTTALVTTYGAFLAAKLVDASGILASVAAGLVIGYRSAHGGSAEARLQTRSFWEVAVFLVESALFVISGLVFQQVVNALGDRSWAELGLEALAVVVVVLGLRALWMLVVPAVFKLVHPRGLLRKPLPTPAERVVLAVAGMRGAVTVAAALSVPLTIGAGEPFPDRDLVLFLAYVTVVVTLVVPSLALPVIVRRLGLAQGAELRQETLNARVEIAHAALERAEQLAAKERYPEEALQRAREAYETRVESVLDDVGDGDIATAYRELRSHLVDAERDALHRIRDSRELPGEALRELEHEIDLEEARLRQ